MSGYGNLPARRRLLVRGACALTMDPALGEVADCDVLVVDGAISAVGRGLVDASAEEIDGRGTIARRHPLRVVDVADPTRPTEIAWYIPDQPPGRPAIQLNDVLVGLDGLIYVTDRLAGGLYILELEAGAQAARPTSAAG